MAHTSSAHDDVNSMAQDNNDKENMQQVHKPKRNNVPSVLDGRLSGLSNATSVTSNNTNLVGSNNQAKQHKLKQRFKVIRKLGKGTYGKVQLAINKETGQEVAIKTIKKTKIENEQDLQRVRREIQIMSSIEHPHIIHIYEVFENKDKIVLVMQYAKGGELYEYVSQSKVLDECEARRLFRQIATAIYYCHKNKICHRDLKLENILLDEKNNAKLADFGLSNVFDKSRHLQTFCGSPLYASPEIVQGSPYEGPEVDCWSLGVLLYTLVYGMMPFNEGNFKKLVKLISEACYYEPKQKSLASSLISRLLCADPRKRATIHDICQDAWVNGLSGLASPTTHINHTSLLQVAQDMANLTPVRLDILLALAPPPQQQQQTLLASETTQDDVTNNEEHVDKKIRENSDQIEQIPGSSLLHVEAQSNESPSSPIASYVVRDLVVPIESKEKLEKHDEVSSNELVDVDMAPLDELLNNSAPPEQATSENIISSTNSSKEHEQLMESTTSPKEEVPELASGEQVAVQQTNIETPHMMESNALADIQMDTTDDCMEQQPQQQQQQQDSSSDKKVDHSSQADQTTDQINLTTPVEEGVVERPKKVKKKVIVVKKVRKKVGTTKKASDNCNESVGGASEESKTSGEGGADKGTTTAAVASKQQQTTGPGKVRIPETFSQTTASQQQQQTSDMTSARTRRPSALIADVSQKLLQQLENGSANSSQAFEDDQAQLAQVKVAEKLNEFERRASLAATSGHTVLKSQSPRGAGSHQQVCDTSVAEPQQVAVSSQRLTSTNCSPDCAIVELVASRVEPSKAELLTTLASAPTVALKTDEPSIHEAEPPQQQPQPMDEQRSDSVETIKADHLMIDGQSPTTVRSTFELNLSHDNKPPPSSHNKPEQHHQQQPLARSYKKVTFTKDGFCITETGKIYSTQADDGTLRRVERKSKVTHYPSDHSTTTSAQANKCSTSSTTKEEEFVYEQTSSSQMLFDEPTFARTNLSATNHNRPHLDRLLMPSNYDDDDDDDQPFLSNQIERNPSVVSSCSSGSTDVFDDIFDTWTGAISMFNQHKRRLPELRSSLLNRAFVTGSPLPGALDGQQVTPQHRLRRRQPQQQQEFCRPRSSTSNRCGSVEPPTGAHSGMWRLHSRKRRTKRDCDANDDDDNDRCSSAASGYESDVPLARGSATRPLVGARGRFGSSNMFPRNSLFDDIPANDNFFPSTTHNDDDDPFGESVGSLLTREMQLEHERLRRKIAQQHKSLWKGSTPALHVELGGAPEQLNRSANHDDLFAADLRCRSASGTLRKNPHKTTTTTASNAPHAQVSTSQSSSGVEVLVKLCVPLASAPIQRNTAQLPDDLARVRDRSTSKLSKMSQQMARMHLFDAHDEPSPSAFSSSARFIELKRDSSSSSASLKQRQQQVGGKHQITMAPRGAMFGTTFHVWDDHHQQTERARQDITDREQEQHFQRANNNETNSRIQSWLQQSAGNLSISSGSKSSASTSDAPATAADSMVRVSLPHHLPPAGRRAHSKSPVPSGRPRIAEAEVANVRLMSKSSSTQQMLMNLANATSSTTKTSIVDESTCETLVARASDNKRVEQQTSNSAHVTSQATFTFPDGRREQQVVSSASACTSKIATSPQVISDEWFVHDQHQQQALPTAAATTTTRTKTETKTTTMTTKLRDDFDNASNDLDSLAGSGADLESRSSGSLLEQLRSRGYRSMINQRMVNTEQGGQQQHRQLVTTAGSPQVITSSSTSVTMSSSGGGVVQTTRVVQHSHHDACDDTERVDSDSPLDDSRTSSSASKQQVEQQQQQQQQLDDTKTNSNAKEQKEIKVGKVEEEELDEDVREAKASIKEYLDRMKETEQFLKTMHEEEERIERQRQELFAFNNLLLSAKLSGIRQPPMNGSFGGDCSPPCYSDYSSRNTDLLLLNGATNGPSMSAPIQMCKRNESERVNMFMLNHNAPTTTTMSCFSSDLYKPLEFNANNIAMHQRAHLDTLPPTNWRRSKSQLADRFGGNYNSSLATAEQRDLQATDYTTSCMIGGSSSNRRRPLSANLSDLTRNAYFPSQNRARCSSQVRHSSANTCWQTNGNFKRTLGTTTDDDDEMMISEYKRAYRAPSLVSTTSKHFASSCADKLSSSPMRRTTSLGNSVAPIGSRRSRATTSGRLLSHAPDRQQVSNNSVTSEEEDDEEEDTNEIDDDDDMREYRAHAYVPKVVPEGGPRTCRGRNFERRAAAATSKLSSSFNDNNELSGATLNERRKSVQTTTESSPPSVAAAAASRRRRFSLANEMSGTMHNEFGGGNLLDDATTSSKSIASCTNSTQANDNSLSRLSELEQRIQANKRRREELLAGTRATGAAAVCPTRAKSVAYRQNDNSFNYSPERRVPISTTTRPSRSMARTNNTESDLVQECNEQDKQQRLVTSSSAARSTRPSRLESMEARIKRRSYCVRLTSPPKVCNKSELRRQTYCEPPPEATTTLNDNKEMST